MVSYSDPKSEDDKTVNKIFKFAFSTFTGDRNSELELNIQIPFNEKVEEFVHRLIIAFNLPCYVQTALEPALKKFIDEETVKYYDEIAEAQITAASNLNFDLDDVIKTWEKAFKTETIEYSEPIVTTDEELFATIYHKLVHSPALETMLQAEHAYAMTARLAAAKRTQQLEELATKQSAEMACAVDEVHKKSNEKEINDLAGKHFEDHSLAAGRLNSEVGALHESQKKEYRSWLMSMLEQQTVRSSPLSSPVSMKLQDISAFDGACETEPWPAMEESFTIHLGSQLKQMHNVRILAANVLDFCRVKSHLDDNSIVNPERVETALALYSSKLSGIVLLTDVSPGGGFTGLAKDFAEVCQQTTEFHFPTLDDQLQLVRAEVTEAVAWRAKKAQFNKDSYTQTRKIGSSKNLQSGDMYITKHSTLSQVHVVFHMLVDDSVKSNDINSRHSVILGMRNVLKTAASHDVTTLTIPLLLSHEMTEDMTVAWCSKRAELVFKCVKGFMIEAAGAGGTELHNLQFLVPPCISHQVFTTLASMLSTIFRVSNPLVLKDTVK